MNYFTEQLQNKAECFHFFPQTPLVKPQKKEKGNDLTI